MRRHVRGALTCSIAALALSGCNIGLSGGDTTGSATSTNTSPTSGTTPTGTAQFTIGGTISGLNQTGLALSSSGNTATVPAGATAFMLPNMVVPGARYLVNVQSQPVGQTCSVSSNSGMAQTNVTNVSVKCTTNTYTIGGLITGLSAGGLVLSNGSDTLTVSLGTSAFMFATALPMGATYNVAVQTQPVGLHCQVSNASGTMSAAAVINLVVSCGQWTWMGGSDHIGAAGTYGTKGMAAPGNAPGARQGSISWIDGSGRLWVFGGGAAGGQLNDLWSYDSGSHQWTWVSGSSTPNASGVYGTQGMAAGANVPGARTLATAWNDGAGNLWLFGGQGYDSASATGMLNDLWRFNIAQGQWTWVSGANTAWASGTAPPNNAPGGRTGAVSWIDASGNLWLFGGSGTQGLTNDLWQFAPTTGIWTLVCGSQTPNVLGAYGTQGTAASTNLPGSRTQSVAATDGAGNFWLFGGAGYGAIGNTGLLNDLWKFTPNSGQWTWVGGSNTINASGTYVVTTATDVMQPGARSAATAVADGSGNLRLFGGIGYDATGKKGSLNDGWKYDVGAHRWIWLSGSQSAGAAGTYGTLGAGAVADTPGARAGSASWIDATGGWWIFAGTGVDASSASGLLNDLWVFTP